MTTSITALAEEHRRIEAELDRFGESLAASHIDSERFRHLKELMIQHYRREEPFIASLREHEPRFADKLREQHEEALEIADRLGESLTAGEVTDVTYLARRFLAIAQHNTMEEERDAFPLAERCFRAEDPPSSSAVP